MLHRDGGRTDMFTNAANNTCNRTGLIFRALSQATDIRGYGTEALTVFTGHSCLNSSVKRQAICLMGNTGDYFYDIIDFASVLTQGLYLICCRLYVLMDTSQTFNGL